VKAKYKYVDSQNNEPGNTNPVMKMCCWLQVSTSGFYHRRGRPPSATTARREVLTARVHHFFEDSDGTYGYRRIHADLADEGTECSPELVRHIMRDEHLIACQPRPFRGEVRGRHHRYSHLGRFHLLGDRHRLLLKESCRLVHRRFPCAPNSFKTR